MAVADSSDNDVEPSYGIAPRLLLASLALASGAVHLAMAPIHAPGSTTEAILFAAVGWAQILLGIGLMLRPNRPLLTAAILLNVAVIGAYVVSRTAGLPWGAHAGVAEDVQGVDLMTTIFEAILVAGAALLLAYPRFAVGRTEGRAVSFEAVAMATAIPLVVLFATSVALADPDLVQHSHGDDSLLVSSGHAHDGSAITDADLASIASNRCDLAFNPAAYWNETAIAGIDTIMGGEATTIGHTATEIQGSPALDALVSHQVTSKGEAGDAVMVLELAKVSDDVYKQWLRWLGSTGAAHGHGSAAAPDDNNGMGGHIGPQPWHAMTDQAQCDKLAAELALARDTALKYPTVADAKAAGWRQVTPYVPGIAAHFMNFRYVDDTFNIEEPEMILYDGTDDDSRVVGLSYYVLHAGTAEPTQGFTGNNDHFHRHDGLCVNAGGVIGDSTTTEEECAARGGQKRNGSGAWMNHAWVVPGCESPWGVFSGGTPVLDGDLPKHSGEDGPACGGSGVRDRFNLDPGGIENTPTQVGGEVELALGN